MFALAPLEILLVLLVFYVVFKFFVRLLNSRALSKTIDEVVHPNVDDDIVASSERLRVMADEQVIANEEAIARKRAKTDRLKKLYRD